MGARYAMARQFLIVSSHPSPNSLCAQITCLIAETIASQQEKVVVEELYSQKFDPVISETEYSKYFDPIPPSDLIGCAANLRWASDLIFVFPVWMYAMPALLKGYFDRVWRPHLSFQITGGTITPLLRNIQRLSVIATHGMSRTLSKRVGDSTRIFFERSLPSVLPELNSNCRFDIYNTDKGDYKQISIEIAKIRSHFAPGHEGEL
jgi:putative NADPH-quinone reductase